MVHWKKEKLKNFSFFLLVHPISERVIELQAESKYDDLYDVQKCAPKQMLLEIKHGNETITMPFVQRVKVQLVVTMVSLGLLCHA